MIGLPDPVGLEIDAAACATRAAAGLATVRTDIARFPVAQLAGRIWGTIGSPPCTTFSSAGSGAGTEVTDQLAALIRDQFAGRHTMAVHRRAMAAALLASGWLDGPPPRLTAGEWRKRRQAGLLKALRDRRLKKDDDAGERMRRHKAINSRPRGYHTRAERQQRIWAAVRSAALVAEPARYIAACWPEWVALEQVPEVLPLWEVYAAELRARGYHAWTGILNAADYGVPQTRRRAILIASKSRRVGRPPSTHYDPRKSIELFGDPWVSMADALQFGATSVPAPSVTAGGTRTGGAEPFGHRSRNMLTAEMAAGRWMTAAGNGQATALAERPAPARPAWTETRPATTVLGEARIGRPGHKGRKRGDESMFAVDSTRVTVAQAAVLQSFPPGHPWQGTVTAQYMQVGNAVPPLLAAHVLAEATRSAGPAAKPGPQRATRGGESLLVRTSYGDPKDDGRTGSHLIDAAARPAHTVTSKVRSWQVPAGQVTGVPPPV
jgi:DNA (cytosine-5)-methyltransferase 1